jgi:hypothetical protein
MMWALLNPRLIAFTATLILLAGSVVYAYSKGRQYGMQEVQILWDSEKAQTLAAQAEEQMKARQTEQALQALANRIRQEKKREATRLVNDYAAVINSLHDRPETRASGGGVPEGATTGVGCTGSGLAKLDAELLAGYSLAANQLQLAYSECREKYTEIERELNKD